jgi:Trk-type K+ transport system membrane component
LHAVSRDARNGVQPRRLNEKLRRDLGRTAKRMSTVQRDELLDYADQRTRAYPDNAVPHGVLSALVIAFLLFNVLAILGFHLPGVGISGQELSFRRTVFAAVNATTLTGFQQDVGSSLVGADVLRLALTLGGTLFTLIAGGMAVVRIARMPYTDGQVARCACVAVLAATLVGAAVLLNADRPLVASALQAASAFGNSGLYAGRLPGVLDWRTHAVLMPLAFLGALGLPVLMELFDRLTGARKLSTHSGTVLVLAAGVYLLGTGVIALLDATQATPAHAAGDWRSAFAQASTFAVNARSAGLPFEFAAAFARPAQWIIVALMIIGGAPGGTAGGLKTTTLLRAASGVRNILAGRAVARSVGVALTFVAVYAAIIIVGLLLLLNSEPDMGADRLLFLCVSAASNVGLSYDPVSITGNGLFTLSALMLAGRLAPLWILWWAASLDDGERVAIG